MAAWSFSRKGSGVELLARVVDAESLDGHGVRGRLTVKFHRPVSQDLAEQITTSIVAEVVAVLGEALCHEGLPFTAEELIGKVKARSLSASAKGLELRVDALQVSGRGGAPSRPASRDAGATAPSATSGVMPAMGRTTSRPAPATMESTSTTPRTLWPRATAGIVGGQDAERLGRLFAPCLRDSTASLVLAALGAVDPLAVDRLALLEARPTSATMSQLKREACACLGAVLQRALVGATVERATAERIVDASLGEALAPESVPTVERRRYTESPAPLREFASRAAALLGAPHDAFRILTVTSSYAAALRGDLLATASEVKRRSVAT